MIHLIEYIIPSPDGVEDLVEASSLMATDVASGQRVQKRQPVTKYAIAVPLAASVAVSVPVVLRQRSVSGGGRGTKAKPEGEPRKGGWPR